MGKRELVALLNLSYWCLVMVEQLFLAVPCGCLRFVIVVFPDHTHLLFLSETDKDISIRRVNIKPAEPPSTNLRRLLSRAGSKLVSEVSS